MAKEFSAGTVYVQVVPSLDGWKKDVQAQLDRELANVRAKIVPEIDQAVLRAELAKLRAELDSFNGRIVIDVDVHNQGANAALATTRHEVDALDGRTARVNVDVDNAAAMARLGATNRAVSALNGRTANVNVNANTAGAERSLTRLQLLIGAVVAGAGAIGGLGAAFLALGAGAVVGAAGVAAVVTGTTKITTAMKAQSAASEQAGQTAGQEAAQQLSAANQVLNAQDAIRNGSRAVADAQRNASDSVRQALEGQTRAEESLRQAQVAAIRTQQALTDARLNAARSIEDLQNQVIDNALSQRRAVLDLQTAQDTLNATLANPSATQAQRDEAQLTFDEAKQHLAEISTAYQRSTVDSQAATAAGVDGAKQVVAAQDQVADSQARLTEAQVAAKEAQRAVTEARITGAEQVAAAQQALAHAQRELAQAEASVATQANKQGAAHEKFADALDRLSPQSLQLISYLRSQSGAWNELGKASQAFAPGLQHGLQTLQPMFGRLTGDVATLSGSFGSFLDVVAGGLAKAGPTFDILASSSVELFPRFGETVNRAGSAVGGLVVAMLPLAKPALDAVDAFSALIKTWTPFIVQASGPLLQGLQAVITKLDFLGPLLVAIAKPAADLTVALVSGLRDGFQQLTPVLGPFLQALVNIVTTLSPLLGSAGQLAALVGQVLLPSLQAVNTVLGPLVSILRAFLDVITAIPAPLIAMGLGIYALVRAAGPLATVIGDAGAALGTLISVMGSGTRAAGGFATAGNAIATGFRVLGRALPVIGIAFLGFSEILSANAEEERQAAEAAEKLGDALNKGGSAATTATSYINRLREQARQAAAADLPGMERQLNSLADAAEAAAARQRDSMSAVELAQGKAKQAQADYDRAVRDFGPASIEAAAAGERLRGALGGLKQAQTDAANAAKTHTERLQDLQDQILAMTDANVAHERANLRVQRSQSDLNKAIAQNKKDTTDAQAAQANLNKAIAQHGKDSAAAKDAQDKYLDAQQKAQDSAVSVKEAQLDLTSAQSNYVSTAGAAAEATAKANGLMDTSKAVTQATNQALIELLRTQGDTLPPTILSMIAHIDTADQKFLGLQTTIDNTGQAILHLPGGPQGPPVDITFHDNFHEVVDHTQDLQTSLGNLSKFVDDLLHGKGVGVSSLAVLLGLEPAPYASPLTNTGGGTALPGFPNTVPKGRATGGPVGGSGSGDTVPALLTPGEFVFSAPAVRNVGMANIAAFHAAALRYAKGGPVPRYASGGAVAGSSDTAPELAWLSQIVSLFEAITTAADPLASSLDAGVTPAVSDLTDTTATMATSGQQSWTDLTATVVDSTASMTEVHLPALRTGLSQVDTAITNTANTFATQWSAIRGYAADPIRYALQFPFNQGLIPAWNLIDTTFGVGKPLAPLPIPFAEGGPVFGGVPGKDSVAAYLMPGEFVVPVSMVSQIGMSNLESARRSVLHGGSVEGLVPGFEAGGAVSKALAFATSQIGKPYIWGATGPAGYDCSGLVSAVTNVALGQSPYARRFTTADFASGRGAGGYLPGRDSALVIGVSDAHMAGTISGHNFESTTKNGISGVRVDGDASGALDPQFTKGQFYLPQVGGVFVPGPTGGAPFDVAALLDSTFAATRAAVASIGATFGANTLAAGASAEMTRIVDTVVGWAKANLTTFTGAPGSGPIVDQVRGVAARYGWGEGAEWDALSTLIAHESSWNPTAQNPVSTAFGLFQFLDSTWAAYGLGKTSNPALQAEAGMRYIQTRYGDPIGAWDFWSGHHWYDDGGYLPPGLSLSYNGTGRPERVLTAGQEAALAGGAGGSFTGTLVLDSGEFLGVVHGEIEANNDSTGRALLRRTRH